MTAVTPDPGNPAVTIRGTGIAASCCAHLLAAAGIPTGLAPANRPPVPAILLSDPALTLLRDTFGRPDLFADKPRIERRIVAWGGSDPVVLPHGAIVLAEGDLDAELRPSRNDIASVAASAGAFTVHAAPPFPSGMPRRFGARQAIAAAVHLIVPEDETACWIEAVDDGWLFLIPAGVATGWLLAVGAPVETLIGQSRHLAPRVILLGLTSSAFETYPRLLTALHGADWLACGTAAIAFDPICGDGTAQAVREAILASAVLAAMHGGADPAALLVHYESMLIASMRRHLRLCAQFYRSGGQGTWWRDQLAALSEGFDWCTARLATMPEPRYELHDFRLVPREMAA